MKGYSSPNADRREAALARKRQEYLDCVPQYYDIPDSDRTDDEIVMLHQVCFYLAVQLGYPSVYSDFVHVCLFVCVCFSRFDIGWFS